MEGLRRMLRPTPAFDGMRMANEAVQAAGREAGRASGIEFGSQLAATVVDALAETFAPQPVKTSTLLTEAANMIGDAIATLQPGPESKRLPIFYGRDWGQLVAQLRERAALLDGMKLPVTNDIDHPQLADFTDPLPSLKLHMKDGQVIDVDMIRLKEAAERLGLGDIRKGDVLSIDSHRNAKGEWMPNYQSVRIEREAKP